MPLKHTHTNTNTLWSSNNPDGWYSSASYTQNLQSTLGLLQPALELVQPLVVGHACFVALIAPLTGDRLRSHPKAGRNGLGDAHVSSIVVAHRSDRSNGTSALGEGISVPFRRSNVPIAVRRRAFEHRSGPDLDEMLGRTLDLGFDARTQAVEDDDFAETAHLERDRVDGHALEDLEELVLDVERR